MSDRRAPGAVPFVLAYLLPFIRAQEPPLSPATAHLGAKRWKAGGPLPYWTVTALGGPEDMLSAYPTVRVHTLAAGDTAATAWAELLHSHMLDLVDDPLIDVAMADGTLAGVDWVEVISLPHEEPYAAESVVTRLISEYQLALPRVRAA